MSWREIWDERWRLSGGRRLAEDERKVTGTDLQRETEDGRE